MVLDSNVYESEKFNSDNHFSIRFSIRPVNEAPLNTIKKYDMVFVSYIFKGAELNSGKDFLITPLLKALK